MRSGTEVGAVSSRSDVSLKSQFLILNTPRFLTPFAIISSCLFWYEIVSLQTFDILVKGLV